ncbi:hypothetical protein O181_073880 [Austropuccinia psidii MF-1]|uniref:Uncharacterized protein n=1 Tax=Austropuccinia psidii MF-1 TaxID=1389203 RepID=A0A9Q3F3G0_9BASI|nr:hypothetical protein [Austropuccinia psidii MF-1]
MKQPGILLTPKKDIDYISTLIFRTFSRHSVEKGGRATQKHILTSVTIALMEYSKFGDVTTLLKQQKAADDNSEATEGSEQ